MSGNPFLRLRLVKLVYPLYQGKPPFYFSSSIRIMLYYRGFICIIVGCGWWLLLNILPFVDHLGGSACILRYLLVPWY